eukprot:jgi/Astpho2/6879/Aster-07878
MPQDQDEGSDGFFNTDGPLPLQLVEVINEDYNDFISLSTKLVNVDGAVMRMSRPIIKLKEKLQAVHAAVQAELNLLNEGLQRRQQAAAAKALLELMQDTAHAMAKVEKLLSEVEALHAQQAGQSQTAAQMGSLARLLERVGGEVGRLKFCATKGQSTAKQMLSFLGNHSTDTGCPNIALQNLPAVQQLEPRISAAVERLNDVLRTALDAALRSQEQASMLLCLRAYAAIGNPAGAEQIGSRQLRQDIDCRSPVQAVRNAVVAPLVAQVLSEHRASQPRAVIASEGLQQVGRCQHPTHSLTQKAKSPQTHLSCPAPLQVLSNVAARVQEQCSGLLQQTDTAQTDLQAFDFLGGAVMAEVDQAVSEAMPGASEMSWQHHALAGLVLCCLGAIGAVGQALHCCKRRPVSREWSRAQLLPVCSTGSASARPMRLQAFRNSTAVASFFKRWKLSVYFSLRFQDIAMILDTAVTASTLQPVGASAPNPLHLHLQPPAALQQSLDRCVADDVFLQPLAGKFIKLVLQLLARYHTWLERGLAQRAAHDPQAGAEQACLQLGSGTWLGLIVVLFGAATALWQPIHNICCRDEALSTQLPSSDFHAGPKRGAIITNWHSSCHASGLGHVQVLDALQGSLEQSSNILIEDTHRLTQMLADSVVEKCVQVLRQLRGITATYRMTTRPLPTRPSHFVTGVLQPLRALTESNSVKAVQRPAQLRLVEAVVEGVSTQYAAMAAELLDTLRKTESSLARLRRNRPAEGAAADGSQLSDMDKISTQLFLDVQICINCMGKGGGSCLSSENKADQRINKSATTNSATTPSAGQPAPVAAATQQAPVTKMGETNIAIIIYSMYGHVAKLAEKVKAGLDTVPGIKATIYRVPETLPQEVLTKMHAPPPPDYPIMDVHDLDKPDGFVFGFPTRYGNMAGQMKAFWDATGGHWQKQTLVGKPGAMFTSTASQGGGQEVTIMTALTHFVHHGMIYVPPGYTMPGGAQFSLDEVHGGSPWGAGTFAGADGSRQPTATELAVAEHQASPAAHLPAWLHIGGKEFGKVAKKLCAK